MQMVPCTLYAFNHKIYTTVVENGIVSSSKAGAVPFYISIIQYSVTHSDWLFNDSFYYALIPQSPNSHTLRLNQPLLGIPWRFSGQDSALLLTGAGVQSCKPQSLAKNKKNQALQGGRKEEGSGWGTRVYLWQIHVDIWQNQYNVVKLKNLKKKRKKKPGKLIMNIYMSIN